MQKNEFYLLNCHVANPFSKMTFCSNLSQKGYDFMIFCKHKFTLKTSLEVVWIFSSSCKLSSNDFLPSIFGYGDMSCHENNMESHDI